MKIIAIAAALLLQIGCVTTQAPQPPAPVVPTSTNSAEAMAADTALRKGEMANLSGLVGHWTGPGWRILPNGTRVEYDQTVVVVSKMGGQVFTIEGASVRRPQIGPPGTGSLAVITWEPTQNRYAFRSFTGGRLTDADGYLTTPDTFVWTVKGPPLGLRFSVTFNGDTWREIGEVSRDGEKTWQISYQLEMRRSSTP